MLKVFCFPASSVCRWGLGRESEIERVFSLKTLGLECCYKAQRHVREGKMKAQLRPTVEKLCQAEETVSSELAKNPSLSPGEVAGKLYGKRESTGKLSRDPKEELTTASEEDLKKAFSCGRWGPTHPTELFLRAYHDALCCLEADPLCGMVSPSLMGSFGSIPLTVIAPLVDVIRHASNVIVRAKKEVLFATCSWLPSDAVKLISDSFKELSRRAGARGERVVVKIIFAQASAMSLVRNRRKLSPAEYSGGRIQLPKPEEVPNLDMEVRNLHAPLLGTLHAKFIVVDREIGFVQSNNMEDNANMEMATHLEGPIVDSLYDSFLITWYDKLDPSLPTLNVPASQPRYATHEDSRRQQDIVHDGAEEKSHLPPHNPGDPHYDDSIHAEITRIQAMYSPTDNETPVAAINRHLNNCSKSKVAPTAPEEEAGDEFTPYVAHATGSFPIAMVSRRPYGPPGNSDAFVPQNEAFLSLILNAKRSIFIQTPDLNSFHLLPALIAAIKRGITITYYVCAGYNDAGEMMPGQGGTNETFAVKLCSQLSPEERTRLHIHWYTAKDQIKLIHQKFRQRSCHLKLLIADGQVGIQGSGNQDTQSWYHSQEINVMIDSEEICMKWREVIERNQNTGKYGRGSEEDGLWRDENGNEAEGATKRYVVPPVRWATGTLGMLNKMHD